MPEHTAKVTVIGAGIVGLATAWQLLRHGTPNVLVLEAEPAVAQHQTGHNSGVIHSGIYYKPGSAKAHNCTTGREQLYQFCAEYGIAHDRCGKVIVATSPSQLPALANIEQRGLANGLTGLQQLNATQLKEHEPHVAGVAGLFVPQTGIVDYPGVATMLRELIQTAGGQVLLRHGVNAVRRDGNHFRISTTQSEVQTRAIINCAGLYSDRVAQLCGVQPSVP